MSSLSVCLKRIGVGKHEDAILRAMAGDYVRDGYAAHEAAVSAVKDYIAELEKEREEILNQAKAAGWAEPTAAAPEAAPEATAITIEEGGPKPPRKPRQKRTAAEIVESAGAHGVKGIGEAVSGLYELFGGKSLKSFPGGIDEDTYAKAKPHFQKALEEFQAAGRDIKALVKWAYDNFSTKIKPYLRRFIAEKKADAVTAAAEEGGSGITIETPEEQGGKKKRGPKLQDTGEALGGKRSSKDHRTRTEAIEIELGGASENASAQQLVASLVKKTNRSNLFKIEHPVEGRTFGVKRFLNQVRNLTHTWHDRTSYDFGRYRRENAVKALERYAEDPKHYKDMTAKAAEYISVFEQLNDAVKTASTVAEARHGLLKAILGEELAEKFTDVDAMKEHFGGANPSRFFSTEQEKFTDMGKALVKWVEKPYAFGDMLFNGWLRFAANEGDQTKNLPIVRERKNIFEIETPETYRNGRDVTPEELIETFSLRGIDFGEWVEADFRQRSVNLTYDSFKMLAEALGANDKGISLSDTMRLGIGWGARGQGGKTAAAFWPGNRVIGLTKTKGDGSLAHEWGHAFDFMVNRENMIAQVDGREVHAIDDLKDALKNYYKVEDLENRLMDRLRGMWSSARNRTSRLQEAKNYLKNEAINDVREYTEFFNGARKLDGGLVGKYWSKKEEMWARSFEAYVADKLQGSNLYLVDEAFVAPGGVEQMFNRKDPAYPTAAERERFKQLFDDFFSQIEWSEDGVPKLKPDYVPVTTLEKQRAEKYINDLAERVDSIYEALYGGEQSEDGLYWYAYEQTSRGVAAQPKGYIAYDDSYKIETESAFAGTGAVAYSEPLKADDVLGYFLRSVKHDRNATTIELEVPDGTITDMGPRGIEALEEAPPEDVRPPAGAGVTGTGGVAGAGEGGGGGAGSDGVGGERGGGEGIGIDEVDLSPVGGGGADTSTGLDAVQSAPKLDYTIRPSSNLETTNVAERFNNNIAAIRTLKQIEAEGRMATAQEQDILVRYSGWGELANSLDSDPPRAWQGRAEIVHALLTDEEIQAARRSSLDAYYTPPSIGHSIYEGLQRLGFSGGKVIEPSSGIGHFFGTMPEDMRRNSVLTAVEMDSLTARIARQLYQTANVLNQPFEKTSVPDNFYDLSISNVPFGDQQIHDRKHNPEGFRIHDYFINKMVNITKPGGLVVAISSTGTMDKENSRARKVFSEKAELIGAIRLPNGIFPGAAAGADIIFLRKKGEGLVQLPKVADWVKADEITLPAVFDNGTSRGYTSTVPVNHYFAENKDNIIGPLAAGVNRYGQPQVYIQKQTDTDQKIAAAIDRLPASVYTTAQAPIDIDPASMIPEAGFVKDFAYYVGEDGKIYQNQGGNPKLQEDLSEDQINRVAAMIGMRDTIRSLLRSQALDNPENVIKRLRKRLNAEYDAFVDKYGPLNLRKNARLILQNPDAGLLFGLEHWDKTQQKVKQKAAIFFRNTVQRARPPKSAETSHEGLLHSLMWRGRVDLNYIGQLTGKTRDTVLSELKGRIFDDPEKGFVTSDEYLSGNVKQKLAAAKSAAEMDPKYKENVEALEIVQPLMIPAHEIGVKLGASWIPADVVRVFVNDLFGGHLGGFHIDHVIETGLWHPHFRGRTQAQAKRYEQTAKSHTVATDEFGTREVNLFGGTEYHRKGILDYALNGGFPEVYIEVVDDFGGTRRVKSARLTDAANAKLSALHARFSSWVAENESIQKKIEEVYNDRFNALVERKFDGGHLTFPGKVPDEVLALRPHQKNAVWRALQTGKTYFAHEVGTGKTFSMIGSIMESRRLGLAKKPMMIVKKATIEQIAGEFLRLYPGANILVLKIPENMEKRKRVMSRVATGDYDAVIINHDSFKRIPILPETEGEIINHELQRFARALEEAQAANAARHTIRDIERRVEQLRQKLAALADQERDPVPTIEEMGIDMVVVDEAHIHKNIGFPTKFANLKGVEPKESDIAFDLFMKTQYLHKRYGRGIIMASGTPLTNSVGELYNISRYLHPDDLDRLGISTFDAWAQTFGEMKKEAEYAPEGGGFKLTSRFARFVNVPELMALTRQNMDIKTADELSIPRPAIKNGKPEPVMVEQNEYVRQFQQILKSRVIEVRMRGPRAEYRGYNDNMLRIVTDGRLVAMDPRLYDTELPDYPETKTNEAVGRIHELYRQQVDAVENDPESKNYGKPYKEKRHLQLIFADRGVPGGEEKFNLYKDIKDKLVAKGVPAGEIAFIHDAKNDSQKLELFRKANAGEIRILIGSTGMMGIGVNVQQRVSNMHHLDVDWTYANYEQRNGRGWRFGNRVKEVGIYNYGTKQTVDAFMWSTVAFKERVLKQVMSNDPKIRHVEDISKTSIEASEMEGLLADDPLHKEKIELEDEVRRLSNIRSEYEASRRRARERLARVPLEIQAQEKAVENNHIHLQIAESINALQVGDQAFNLETEGAKANEAAKSIVLPVAGNRPVGQFGHLVTVETTVKEKDKKGEEVEKKVKSKRFLPIAAWLMGPHPGVGLYKIGQDVRYEYPTILANGVSRGLTNVKNGLEANRKEAFDKANSLRKEIPRLEKLLATPWDQENELAQKDQRLRQITEELLRRQDEEDARMRREIQEREAAGAEETDADDTDEVRLAVGDIALGKVAERGLGMQRGSVERIRELVPVVERAMRRAGLPQEAIDLVRIELKPIIDLSGRNVDQTLADWAAEGKTMSQILGATTMRKWTALVELSLEQDLRSLERTAYHESFHIAAKWLLPETDYDRIMQHYQSEEGAAEAFADFVSRRSGGQPAPIGALRRAFLKLRELLRQVGDFLRGRGWTNPEEIFGRLTAGKYPTHFEAWGQGETTTALRKSAPQASIIEQVTPAHVHERVKKAFGGIDRGPALQKIKEGLKEIVKTFTPGREYLAMNPKHFGKAYEILRNFKATKQYADRKALDSLREILDPKNMSKQDYELFTLKIALEDLARELGENGKYANWEAMVEKYGALQFGFQSADEVMESLGKVDALVKENAKVKGALARREEITGSLLKRVVEAKLLPESVLKDKRYFHHQVLEYLNDKFGAGTGAGALRVGKRGYQFGRIENVKDYSLAYIESEYEVIAHQISQIEKQKNLDEMKAAYDIAKRLRDKAKQMNYVAVVGGQENMNRINHLRGLIAEMKGSGEKLDSGEKAQLKEWAEEIRELDPTMPYRQRIAIGYAKLSKALGLNVDEADVDDYAIDMGEIAKYAESSDEALAIPARMIFKAMGERNAFIQETLGGKFVTETDLARDEKPIEGSQGWTEWVPNPRSAFYLTGSIQDATAQQIIAGSRELQESDIHPVLARGRDETWIIPQELAAALESRQFFNMPHETIVSRVSEKTLNAWKRWVLINPMRIVKYNLNNTSGDFDIAFAYDPKILKYAKQAAADLWRWHYGKEMTPALKSELDTALRDEVIGSGMTVHDIPDVRNQEGLQQLVDAMGAGHHSALRTIEKFWQGSKNFTTWRENVLRLAAYRYFKAKIGAGKRVYGASLPAKVDATTDPDRKAALLSRELVGDYGALSQGGQWLRRKLIPFYSWLEINAPRYYRLYSNLAVEGESRGRELRMGAVAAKKGLLLSAKVFAVYAAAQMFNHLFWPDEEEELGETGRRQAHLILGRREDGSIITLRLQGALSDALSWLNLHDFPEDMREIATGKKTVYQWMAEAAVEPVNKMVQGVRPEIKAPTELITGRTIYPEFWKPRPIRDRAEYVAQMLSADSLYRRAAGKPLRGDSVEQRVLSDLLSIFTYSADPGETSYYKARDLVNEYLRGHNLERPLADPTSRVNSLFYYKQAIKYGDAKAAEKYLQQYKDLGGDMKGIQMSVKRAHPLGNLPAAHRSRFFNSLDAQDRETVKRATAWYRDTYKQGGREAA
jgi:N12 class adenine-specific DNA methylase